MIKRKIDNIFFCFLESLHESCFLVKRQVSGIGGIGGTTRSPPATPHRLRNPTWPEGGGGFHKSQTCKNFIFVWEPDFDLKMSELFYMTENGRQRLERGLL